MESEFKAFLSYDFSSDSSFETGLKTIKEKLVGRSEEDVEQAIEKAKFVRPFDFQAFQEWKQRTSTAPATNSAASDYTPTTITTNIPPTITDLETDVPPSTSADDTQQPHYPKTFAEICALVAQGKPIPGIRQIPTTVHGEDKQSRSVLPMRKKPWEVDGNDLK
ncbi:hypothetical protein HDU67_010171 [Dinochytrium kinnereticum]|nr:hypothetical protein HDU67_010171 [Dinochytrium kinnereticum]